MKRDMKEAMFKQTLDDVENLIEKGTDQEPLVISRIFSKVNKEMNTAFNECKEANDKYIELLSQEDMTSEISWMKGIQKSYNKITDREENR